MSIKILSAVLTPQFLIYVGVGVLTALVDVGTMALMLNTGVNVTAATTSGFALGLVVNQILHTKITFAARFTFAATIRFWMIVAINYGLTLLFVFVASWLEINAITGKLASLPAVAINGFLLSKFWAFR